MMSARTPIVLFVVAFVSHTAIAVPDCTLINAKCDALIATCSSPCNNSVSCNTGPSVICSVHVPSCRRAKEVCAILASGTLLPTAVPTSVPTIAPTPVPTPSPPTVTAYPRCDDVLGIEVARKVRYYSRGPGTTFTFPVDLYVAGFSVTFTWGPGMRCHESAFPHNSYLGCEINGFQGFSEFIVNGTNRGDPILIPSPQDPNFKPMLYESPANQSLLLYSLKNCEFSPLQVNMRASLSSARMIRKGTVLSLWHSEAYHNFDVANNVGYSEVSIFAIKAYTPHPTRVPTIKPTPVPTAAPTLEPTRLPTNAPLPRSELQCSLGRDTISLMSAPRPYNSTGPGMQVTVLRNVLAKGFAIEFRAGPGIRCSNAPFTRPSYLGCSTPLQGFAETIILGAGRNGRILVPDPADSRLIPLATVPGDSSKILTYGLTNCAFPTWKSILSKVYLSTPVQLHAGDVLTLWNSEAYYQHTTSDNSGWSAVVLHAIR